MPIYHGGCHGCQNVDKETPICLGCQYFEANWNLPDLNEGHIQREFEKALQKKRLKEMARCNKCHAAN